MKRNRTASLGVLIFVIIVAPFTYHNANAQSALDLTVQYVAGTPVNGEIAYDVNVYLSVTDAKGDLVPSLLPDSFTIVEDSKKVEIQSLLEPKDGPVSVVLVMDASGSMAGPGFNDAKEAAKKFVSALGVNDEIAILTFDNSVRTQVDFTSDRNAVADRIDKQIDAKVNSDSCLFDAASQAVEMLASEHKTGNRAVVLFTDGTDETVRGSVCSSQTKDNVISNANDFIKHTPIFTIGIGSNADPVVKEIAERTGGLYHSVTNTSKLTNVLQTIAEELHSQYVLTYKSLSLPGPHRIAVELKQQDTVVDNDSRNFTLDPIQTQIIFVSPQENETVSGLSKISVNVLAQSEIIQRVAFEVNGVVVGTDDFTPYELNIDMKQFPPGATTISVAAYGGNNNELTHSLVNVVHAEETKEETQAAPATEVVSSTTEIAPVVTTAPETVKNTSSTLGFALGGLGIVIIAILLFVVLRQQRQTKIQNDDEDYKLNPLPADMQQAIPVYSRKTEPRSPINFRVDTDALGSLTIEASDDTSMIGHRFEIMGSSVSLGRGADNDLNFPNDKPVSRHHAEIYFSNRKLYLRVIATSDASGVPQLPKYGTFLNQIPVGSDSVPLKNGDEIQLGKRVRLKFEAYQPAEDEDARTYDDMESDEDSDQTQES